MQPVKIVERSSLQVKGGYQVETSSDLLKFPIMLKDHSSFLAINPYSLIGSVNFGLSGSMLSDVYSYNLLERD